MGWHYHTTSSSPAHTLDGWLIQDTYTFSTYPTNERLEEDTEKHQVPDSLHSEGTGERGEAGEMASFSGQCLGNPDLHCDCAPHITLPSPEASATACILTYFCFLKDTDKSSL